MSNYKVVALDLDGTITQHRSHPEPAAFALLDALRARYRVVMVGAGNALRIHNQMQGYPVDIIGNYGMQYAVHDPKTGELKIVFDENAPCDRDSVTARVQLLRDRYGYTSYAGDSVEFHPSGMITIPLIGTKADIRDKLVFDPDKKKRAAIYEDVKALFPDYTVFIGGSSSFDMAPAPYNKYYALDRFCRDEGIAHDEVVYVGDDYGPGGGDEALHNTDFRFVEVDDYRNTPSILSFLLD